LSQTKPSAWENFKASCSEWANVLTGGLWNLDPAKDLQKRNEQAARTDSESQAEAVFGSTGANRTAALGAHEMGVGGAKVVMDYGLMIGIGAIEARAGQLVYKTTKEAAVAAEALGFSKVKGKVHGEAVFTNGKVFITRDATGHNGGAWKMGKTIKDLASKETRMGTYDAMLNWIGK
jgi:hypothetical protein